MVKSEIDFRNQPQALPRRILDPLLVAVVAQVDDHPAIHLVHHFLLRHAPHLLDQLIDHLPMVVGQRGLFKDDRSVADRHRRTSWRDWRT